MTDSFRLTLAQMNPTVGALRANADKAHAAWEEGRAAGADMVALTEMFITGYNAQDLVMKPAFRDAAMAETAAFDLAPVLGVLLAGQAIIGFEKEDRH